MGDQLYLERFVWFDAEARKDRFPNATKLAERFELSVKSAQRTIDHFRDRLQAPFEYESSKKRLLLHRRDLSTPHNTNI